MTRSRTWGVRTGWEKRIRVDFPLAGAHARWSDWTDQERDIVARKYHQIAVIRDEYGARSKPAERWARENEEIMIGFSRDAKPMPGWAYDDFEDSGVPDNVDVIWHQPSINEQGKWIYDPPKPWDKERQTPLSQDQKDFLRYCSEAHHGFKHQLKWARVLLATGYEWDITGTHVDLRSVFSAAETVGVMDYAECIKFYEHHSRNRRWTQARKWYESNGRAPAEDLKKVRKRDEDLYRYHNAPPVQGHYTIEEWRRAYDAEPKIVDISGDWGQYIVDPMALIPLWKLEGEEGESTGLWEYKDGDWIDLTDKTTMVPLPTRMAEAVAAKDWEEVARIATEMAGS